MDDTYRIKQIGNKAWQILEHNFCAIYYLEGDTRGLLIDTGIGADDLCSYIDSVSSKPYDVVLTHGHYDHIGGIYQYPHVFMNSRDNSLIAELNDENRKWFIEHLREVSEGRSDDKSSESMVTSKQMPIFTDIDEGYIFDLGNRDVRVMATQGHTDGCVCLLDEQERLLFVGDSIIYRLLLLGSAIGQVEKVKAWQAGTKRIFNNLETYKGIYMGHSGLATQDILNDLPIMTDAIIHNPTIVHEINGVPGMRYGKTQLFFSIPKVGDKEWGST
jgi:glyoxylase-like metal-dependent hydrolase (beta-lactamase superfamily II)